MHMFCVRCGKEGETVEGLCPDCYLETNTLAEIADRVDVETCTNCHEYRIHNRWREFATRKEAVTEAALAALGVRKDAHLTEVATNAEAQDDRNVLVDLRLWLEAQGLEKVEELSTVVRVKNTVCQRCSRQLGNYYEAIIQIRGTERNLDQAVQDEVVQSVRAKVDRANSRNAFITKEEGVTGGADLYLSSSSLARNIVRDLVSHYGAETKESSSLVGRREGKDMYRMTYLVRMPGYVRGDIVDLEGSPFQVMDIDGRGVKMVSLRGHRTRSLKPSDMGGVKVLDKPSAVETAVVVSQSEEELQVMHPRDYSTVTMSRPEGYQVRGETVAVYLRDGELYLMP